MAMKSRGLDIILPPLTRRANLWPWAKSEKQTSTCQDLLLATRLLLVRKPSRQRGIGSIRINDAALKRYAVIRSGANDRIDLLIARYENEILPNRAVDTVKGRKKEFKQIRKVFGEMAPKDLLAADAWNYFQKRGGNQAGCGTRYAPYPRSWGGRSSGERLTAIR